MDKNEAATHEGEDGLACRRCSGWSAKSYRELGGVEGVIRDSRPNSPSCCIPATDKKEAAHRAQSTAADKTLEAEFDFVGRLVTGWQDAAD